MNAPAVARGVLTSDPIFRTEEIPMKKVTKFRSVDARYVGIHGVWRFRE